MNAGGTCMWRSQSEKVLDDVSIGDVSFERTFSTVLTPDCHFDRFSSVFEERGYDGGCCLKSADAGNFASPVLSSKCVVETGEVVEA